MRATAQELEQIIRVARQSRQVLLATVNEDGGPVFTPVQDCRLRDETVVSIKAWTDIPPAEAKMALLIWDTRENHGYELDGHVIRTQDTAVLNGYTPIEDREHFPQVQREIMMEVDSIEDLLFGAKQDGSRPHPAGTAEAGGRPRTRATEP